MDDKNLPLDDDQQPDAPGAFSDGSDPYGAFSDGGDAHGEPLIFDESAALPPATPVDDADVIGEDLPAFVDGSSFLDAVDTSQEADADWEMDAVAYADAPVELVAEAAGEGHDMPDLAMGYASEAAMPEGFSSAAAGFQPVDAAATATDYGSDDGGVGLDDIYGPEGGDIDPPFVQGELAEPPADQIEADGEAPAATGGKKTKAPKGRSKDNLMLGIQVTPKQVYGVLIRPTSDGYEPLRQFVRNRSDSGGAFGDSDALSPDTASFGEGATPELASSDVSISFGGGSDIDFSSEFAGIGDLDGVAMDAVGAEPSNVHTQPIVFELKDILDECEQAGFGRPPLALAIGAPDVDYLEVIVPPDKKKTVKKKASKKSKKDKAAEPDAPKAADAKASAPVKRDRLMSLLTEAHPAVAHKDRVAFVPMTAREGHRRYLAVLPQAGEPVAPSLTMLRQQGRHARTTFRTLEGEVPLLVGLSRLIVPGTEGENTAVVRVGTEDTLVLLLADGQLHHYEIMQSVTAFDGPDTICSRVLLQQDVQGIGTIHNVVILADELERELVQGFSAFYPESHVETFRDGLARQGLVGPYGPLAPSLVEAAGVALSGAMGKKGPFEDANLLPADLLKRKRRVDFSIAWHTVAVGMLLFLSVLFFAYLYVSQSTEIANAEQRLAEYPVEAQMTVPQLQARIDSLRQRQVEMAATMAALDSLIVGTDAWTQTLLKSTRAASGTGGIWIEDMEPNGANLQISGYATSRDRVVGMAQRLGGTIDEMTYQDLREYPVYEYRITFPMEGGLPQVTRILREQADVMAPPPDPSDAALDAALGEDAARASAPGRTANATTD